MGWSNIVQPSLEDIQQTERLAANGILSKGQRIDQIIELVEDARYRLTTLITPILAKTPVACRPGCAWCCHFYVVMASIPEILVIAEHLHRTLSEAELKEVRQRVTTTLTRRCKQAGFQPTLPFIPCPLLVNDHCSTYEVRPLVCQAWYSADVRLCQQPDGGMIANQEVMPIFSAVYDGLLAALADHNLENREVELIPALKIALSTPHAGQRWLAGESLFAAAAAPSPTISVIR
jgi:Fe-S-cluster containining protein